jgi:predicted dinucleotide-binding enzyme
VAAAFAGATVVKTLNQLPAKSLAMDPTDNGGRRLMFVSGNHLAASTSIAKLLGNLGFAPILLGKIAEGGALLEMGSPLLLQKLIRQG